MSKLLDIEYKIMEEEFAFSMGIQAYIFGLPMTIFERERRIRLDPELIAAQADVAPVAPINQIGNMSSLATSDDILPYTPNNDTIYSGGIVELIDEPIIMTTPDILDRYWSVEVADTFLVNRFYLGSRANDGYGGNHAFVGPNFLGELPEGVVEHRMTYNSNIFALRIAVDKNNVDEDTKKVLELQKKFKLTSLSNWNKGFIGEAAVPESIAAKPDYQDPLGFFRLFADLTMDNMPTEIHSPQWKPFHYIGLVPGKKFDSDSISKATKEGLIRAAKMGPNIMKWKVKYRGTSYLTRWNKLHEGSYGTDYLDRAAGALEGLFVHDYEEAIYYSTYESCTVKKKEDGSTVVVDGVFFDSSNKYVMHFEPGQIPMTKTNGFWSLTMYGNDFQLVANEIHRYSISDRTTGVTYNDDESLDIYIQSTEPMDKKKAGNWLPCSQTPGELFRVNYRIYLPGYKVQYPDRELQFIPPILKVSD